MTRSALHWSQQRSSFTGHASLPKPTIAPPQIEQALTGVMATPRCSWLRSSEAETDQM
jgi:hypothetical protein